jgi:hypothetical protein
MTARLTDVYANLGHRLYRQRMDAAGPRSGAECGIVVAAARTEEPLGDL